MSLPALLHPNLMSTDELRGHLKKVILVQCNKEKTYAASVLTIVVIFFAIYLQRFPSQNLDNADRLTLLKLFESFAAPMPRRGNDDPSTNFFGSRSTNQTPAKQSVNSNKRSNHALITPPSAEAATNSCKKVRLVSSNHVNISSNQHSGNSNKRPIDTSSVVSGSIRL